MGLFSFFAGRSAISGAPATEAITPKAVTVGNTRRSGGGTRSAEPTEEAVAAGCC